MPELQSQLSRILEQLDTPKCKSRNKRFHQSRTPDSDWESWRNLKKKLDRELQEYFGGKGTAEELARYLEAGLNEWERALSQSPTIQASAY